jgi:hypothetical protein
MSLLDRQLKQAQVDPADWAWRPSERVCQQLATGQQYYNLQRYREEKRVLREIKARALARLKQK